jgi:hypothetical protein
MPKLDSFHVVHTQTMANMEEMSKRGRDEQARMRLHEVGSHVTLVSCSECFPNTIMYSIFKLKRIETLNIEPLFC